MDATKDTQIIPRDEIGLACRAVRVALVVYASPVILLVLAIGLVGMLLAAARTPHAGRRVQSAVAPGAAPRLA